MESVDHLLREAPPASAVELSRVVQRLRARLFSVDAPPVRIGRYEIVRRIGVGVHGEVFEGTDRALQRRVAIKVLSRAASGDTHAFHEARSAASVTHPNVVEVFAVGVYVAATHTQAAPRPYVAMSFVDGPSLAQWATNPPSTQQRRHAIAGAALGLQAAHDAGVLHGDVKPANVLMGDDGVARLADFGNAAIALGATEAPGAIVGTPGYIAPEAYEGVRSRAADQFGLAATAWEVLTGVAPFASGTEEELRRAAERQRLQRPLRLSDPTVPSAALGVLTRGMSPRPSDRWPSVGAMTAALTRAFSFRRRWWRAGIVGAAAASVCALMLTSEQPPCADIIPAAKEVWDDGRAERMQALAEGLPREVASDLVPALRERLDTWSSSWVEARTRVCGTPSPESSRVRQCLNERLMRVDEALGVVEGDPTVFARALGVVGEHLDLADCRMPPPAWIESESATKVRRLAARADALRRAGRGIDARNTAERARSIAVAERDRSLIVEADLVWAEAIATTDPARGRAGLEAVAWRALGADRRDIAVEAAASLAHAVEGQASTAWAERSSAWAAGGTSSSTIMAADAEAHAAYIRGDYEAALEHASAGLALLDDDDRRRRPHFVLAEANANAALGHHDQAMEGLRRARDLAEDAYGRWHPFYATTLNELAIGHLDADEFEAARALYLEAYQIIETLQTRPSLNHGRVMSNLGTIARQMGDPASSMEWLDRAADVFSGLGEEGAFDFARTNLSRAISDRDSGRVPRAARRAASAVATLSTHGERNAGLLAYAIKTLDAICDEPAAASVPQCAEPTVAIGSD